MKLRGLRSSWRQRRSLQRFEAQHGLRLLPSSFVDSPRLVTNGHLIWLGEEVRIKAGARLEVVPRIPGASAEGSLTIGDGCVFEDMVTVSAATHMVIGPGCVLASFVTISDNDHTHGRPGSRLFDQPQAVEPVVLGAGVWVAAGAAVLKGVTIGDRATVGANAVVTKDVPAGAVVGGNPAKELRRSD